MGQCIFPEAGFRFLRQLKSHNDRDWFRERKEKYLQLVEGPMKEMILAVAAGCRSRGIPLNVKERSPVMRVYRDIRFSKNKLPFKTHVAAELRRSFKDSETMLYLHLSPEESFVAAGIWQPARPLLQSCRELIVKEPGRFAGMRRNLKKAKLALNEQHTLSKLPRGFQQYSDEPFAQALKWTSFVVSKPATRVQATSEGFLDSVVDFAAAVRPLLEFTWQAEQHQTPRNRSVLREEEMV